MPLPWHGVSCHVTVAQEATPVKWNFTFNRTSATAAEVVAFEGVTATIDKSPKDYLTTNDAAASTILCINQNTDAATAENPNLYTLTITNNSAEPFVFNYIEVSGVAMRGTGAYQPTNVGTVERNFKVTYGNTTLPVQKLVICSPNYTNGTPTVHRFDAAGAEIPVGEAYTIKVALYTDGGSGCYYGLTQISLGYNVAVSFGSTGYSTLYAPVALAIPEEGVTAYTGAVNGEWLTLTEVENTIPANTGVILVAEASSTCVFERAEEVDAIEGNALKGQASAVAASEVEGVVYTLQSDGEGGVVFKRFTGETLQGGKAYLALEEGQAQALGIRFAGDGSTGIDRLYGDGEVAIYDLQGRRVEKMEKGIYIVNGKKVVIK